jgi:hypothetical protein
LQRRLASLVPRPRLHLIRYHGVLAPNATLRERVVPQGPHAQAHVASVVPPRTGPRELRWSERREGSGRTVFACRVDARMVEAPEVAFAD